MGTFRGQENTTTIMIDNTSQTDLTLMSIQLRPRRRFLITVTTVDKEESR